MTKTTVICAIAFLATSACSEAPVRQPVVETGASAAQPVPTLASTPVRVVVLVDKTGSIHEHHVGPVEIHHFQDILDYLVQAGGKLAIGSITDASNRPLLRLYLPTDVQLPPVEPNWSTMNVFNKKDARRRFDQLAEAWRQEVNQQLIVRHRKVDVFRKAATQVLEQQPARPRSDVCGGIQRAAQFLREPTAIWRAAEPRQFALMITDGLDNVRQDCPQQLPAAAELLLVNGSGSEGVLSPLKPIRFESHTMAIEYLLQSVR